MVFPQSLFFVLSFTQVCVRRTLRIQGGREGTMDQECRIRSSDENSSAKLLCHSTFLLTSDGLPQLWHMLRGSLSLCH
jgi:hypothetical protein